MSVAFALPERLEASVPAELRGLARDEVRLLVTDGWTGTQRDAVFTDLAAFLAPGDLLVVNDSATLPAALDARRASGEAVAVHVSSKIHAALWLVEPRAPVRAGEALALPGGARLVLLAPFDPAAPRVWYALFETADSGAAPDAAERPDAVERLLARHGRPIRYRYVAGAFALDAYQTMFARVPGSSEMPSAGRPFTPRVVARLAAAGVTIAPLTLHAGVSSLERHERPLPEPYAVPAATARAVNAAAARGGRVIAVGTTVVRALESAVDESGRVIPAAGWTELIVTPERRPRVVDGLLTGFHEPQASHLDLLRAFVDPPLLAAAYAHAVAAGYLWHEFGDVHLIA